MTSTTDGKIRSIKVVVYLFTAVLFVKNHPKMFYNIQTNFSALNPKNLLLCVTMLKWEIFTEIQKKHQVNYGSYRNK